MILKHKSAFSPPEIATSRPVGHRFMPIPNRSSKSSLTTERLSPRPQDASGQEDRPYTG